MSPGIAFGRAYLIGRDTLKAPRHHIEADDVDTEIARLYKAIARERQAAREDQGEARVGERERLPHHHRAPDDAPRRAPGRRGGRVHPRRARSTPSGRCAARSTTSAACSTRSRTTYLRERAQRRRVRVRARAAQPARPRRPARSRRRPMRSSSRTTCRRPTPRSSTRPRSSGLITDAGGKTSHTAIIARAHEIPAVVGLENITELVETDDLLLIDGAHRHRDRQPVARRRSPSIRDEQRRQVAAGRARCTRCAICRRSTRDGADIQLLREHRRPRRDRRRARLRRDGRRPVPHRVPVHGHGELPDEETHYQTAVDGARAAAAASRRRSARSTSAPTSSRRSSRRPSSTRRTRRSACARSGCACRTSAATLFRPQLRGLLRASAHGPLKLMFPMISGRRRAARGQGRRRRGQARAAAARASRSTRTSSSAS